VRWNTLEKFSPSELQTGVEDAYQKTFPGLEMVDYRQVVASNKLVADLVSGVAATGMQLAYLDEVSSNELNPNLPPWATTMSVLKRMVDGLHNRGVRVIANTAWHIGTTSQANVDLLLGTGVDGISLEEGFPASVRQNSAAIQTAVGQYRQLLDAGQAVIFIPDPNNYAADSTVLAAWGMMFRQPGDRLFIDEPFYLTTVPAWADWTQSFGAPAGPYSQTVDGSGEIILSRVFAHGQVSLNTFTGTVTTTNW
jgi:hypothetical protein